jgi:outer membrane immunogenic protein
MERPVRRAAKKLRRTGRPDRIHTLLSKKGAEMTSRLIRSGFVAMALVAAPFAATAADLARAVPLPPAMVAPPLYNWSGFYLGINGGGAWGSSNWSPHAADVNVSGGQIGGTLGFNVQTGAWVWGVEGDFDWSGLDGSTTTACAGTGCATSNSWMSTVRGRIGFGADRFMPYVTGGAAFGNIRASFNGLPEASTSKAGWTVGGGVEYALPGAWTAKLEYLYVDLGSMDCPIANCGAPGPVSVDLTANVFRAGLNYKFEYGGPLVTRY